MPLGTKGSPLSRNADKDGNRPMLRELARVLRDQSEVVLRVLDERWIDALGVGEDGSTVCALFFGAPAQSRRRLQQ